MIAARSAAAASRVAWLRRRSGRQGGGVGEFDEHALERTRQFHANVHSEASRALVVGLHGGDPAQGQTVGETLAPDGDVGLAVDHGLPHADQGGGGQPLLAGVVLPHRHDP